MVHLQFAYPVCLFNGYGLVHLTCRDLPEFTLCLSAEMDVVRILDAAEVVMDSVIDQYISQGRSLPSPSRLESGERLLAPRLERSSGP